MESGTNIKGRSESRLGNFFNGGRRINTSRASSLPSKDIPIAELGAQAAWPGAVRGLVQQNNSPQYNGSAATRDLYGPQIPQNEQRTGPTRRDSDANSVTTQKEKGRYYQRAKNKVLKRSGKNKNEQSGEQNSPQGQSRPPLAYQNPPQHHQLQNGGQRTESEADSTNIDAQNSYVTSDHNTSSHISCKELPAPPSDSRLDLSSQESQNQDTNSLIESTHHEQNVGGGSNDPISIIRQHTQRSESESLDMGSKTSVGREMPSEWVSDSRNFTPVQETGSQMAMRIGDQRVEDDSGQVLGRIGGYLQKVKAETPSLLLEHDTKRPFTLLDTETALHTVVTAYVKVYTAECQLKKTIEVLERKHKTLQVIKKDLENTLARNTKQFDESSNSHKLDTVAHEREVQFFRTQLKEEKESREAHIDKLRDDFQAKRDVMVEDHRLKVQEWSDEVDKLERRLQDQSTKDKMAADTHLKRMTTDLEKRLRDSQDALVVTTQACQQEKEAVMEALEGQKEQSLKDLAAKDAQMSRVFQQERERLERNHQNDMNQRNSEFKTTLTSLEGELEKKSQDITRIKGEHEFEKVGRNKEWVDQDRLVKEEHQRAMDAAAREHQNVIEDWEIKVENLEAKLQQARGAKTKEIQFLKEKHEKEQLALNGRLKADLEALKGALVKRDHFKAMSDHEVALRFQDISTEVDDLARVDWDKRQESRWPFDDYALRKAENPRRTKQYVIQNTLWVVLYEKIFCSPFRVMGDKGKALEREWVKKYGQDPNSDGAPCPKANKDSEKWRYETMKKCVEATGEAQMEGDKDYDLKQDYERCLKEATEEISREMASITPASVNEKQRISALVKNAAKLWLVVGQQRCRMYLQMSDSGRQPARSRKTSLERDGTLGLVVVPELRRVGNAQGERLEKDELVVDCKGSFIIFKPELR